MRGCIYFYLSQNKGFDLIKWCVMGNTAGIVDMKI
jgi:hypothetical protein